MSALFATEKKKKKFKKKSPQTNQVMDVRLKISRGFLQSTNCTKYEMYIIELIHGLQKRKLPKLCSGNRRQLLSGQ